METPDPSSCVSVANVMRDWAACKCDSDAVTPGRAAQDPERPRRVLGFLQIGLEWLGAERPSIWDASQPE